MPRVKAVEFFSGIGGWHSACCRLMEQAVSSEEGAITFAFGAGPSAVGESAGPSGDVFGGEGSARQQQKAEASQKVQASLSSDGSIKSDFTSKGGDFKASSALSTGNGVDSSLDRSSLHVDIIHAFDINPLCNEVYHSNYGKKPSGKSIQSLKAADFEKSYCADIWLMSPPCQPFTRNRGPEDALAGATDINDPRSGPLQALVDAICKISAPKLPKMIALENVVGFETSQACELLLSALGSRDYVFEQYILNPVQFGIPNERPRFYLIAILKPALLISHTTSCPLYVSSINSNSNSNNNSSSSSSDQTSTFGFSEIKSEISTPLSSYLQQKIPKTIGEYLTKDLDSNSKEFHSLVIPKDTLSKSSSWCLDIVADTSRSTSCYTKSYARYSKGTGSVLLINASSSDRSSNTANTGSTSNIDNNSYSNSNDSSGISNNNSSSSSSSSSSNSSSSSSSSSSDGNDNIINSPKRPCTEQSRCVTNESDSILKDSEKNLASTTDGCNPSTSLNPYERVDPRLRHFDSQWYLHTRANKGEPIGAEVGSSGSSDADRVDGGMCAPGPEPTIVAVRYFAPSELLRLFGFPRSFEFPASLTNRKRYEMIGNSVNVTVINIILQRGLANLHISSGI